MKLLPYERIVLQTSLTSEQIAQRFRKNVHPQLPLNPFNLKAAQRSGYEGYLFKNHFTVKPIINYRNSFLPDGKVDFQPSLTATDVTITIKLNPFATAFCLMFSGLITIGFIAILVDAISKKQFSWVVFIPLLMILFMYAMMMAAFNEEKNGLLAFITRLVSDDLIN